MLEAALRGSSIKMYNILRILKGCSIQITLKLLLNRLKFEPSFCEFWKFEMESATRRGYQGLSTNDELFRMKNGNLRDTSVQKFKIWVFMGYMDHS